VAFDVRFAAYSCGGSCGMEESSPAPHSLLIPVKGTVVEHLEVPGMHSQYSS
jgi:hypothetical protein